ncbi:MAG: hypothetical protein ACK5HO_11355, partial [Pseudomonadota bacterium]
IFGPECITIRLKPQKSIFEFALRTRKITILGALATQFHEISGLGHDILCGSDWRNLLGLGGFPRCSRATTSKCS